VLRRPAIGVVLAGGGGRRIGGDKASVELAGRPLLDYPLAALSAVLDDVAVVAKRSTTLPVLSARVAIWLEPDVPSHPLVGVVEALRRARRSPVVVVAGDMPFVTVDLLRALVGERVGSAPAVVARGAGRLQPLCARYEQGALRRLEGFDSTAPARDVVAALQPRILDWSDDTPFFNINRPEDLLQAAALLDAL
jgi:molybdenum cofactor guanylyltransferase